MRHETEVDMLAAKDVELARETARELRARGQAERVRAVEAVLAAVLAAQEPSPSPGVPASRGRARYPLSRRSSGRRPTST